MLVLQRKPNEEICIGDDIRVMVVDVRGDKVRLGISAPRDVAVHRSEVRDAILSEHAEERAEADRYHRQQEEAL